MGRVLSRAWFLFLAALGAGVVMYIGPILAPYVYRAAATFLGAAAHAIIGAAIVIYFGGWRPPLAWDVRSLLLLLLALFCWAAFETQRGAFWRGVAG